MAKTHQQLKAAAEAAIEAVGSDDSVDWETTLDTLEELASRIDGSIMALREEHALEER